MTFFFFMDVLFGSDFPYLLPVSILCLYGWLGSGLAVIFFFLSAVTTQERNGNINDRNSEPGGNSAMFKPQSAPSCCVCNRCFAILPLCWVSAHWRKPCLALFPVCEHPCPLICVEGKKWLWILKSAQPQDTEGFLCNKTLVLTCENDLSLKAVRNFW